MVKKQLLAAVLGAFFLISLSAFGKSESNKNPVSGEPAVNINDLRGDMFSALSVMDSATNVDEGYTSLDEYYLGRAVAANILTIYSLYTQNPALTRYLNLICQSIVVNSNVPEPYNGYHVAVLDSPDFNAFASPGGHIFITKGLIEAAASEDMLAAVIAHELAHIALKHGVQIIADMRFHDSMNATANRAGEITSRDSESAARAVLFRSSIGPIIDTMVKNGYSRAQEFEADNMAVPLLAASGYNPQALTDMLRILQQSANYQRGGFSGTHPSPAERISNVEAAVFRYRIVDTSSFRLARSVHY